MDLLGTILIILVILIESNHCTLNSIHLEVLLNYMANQFTFFFTRHNPSIYRCIIWT